MESQNNAEKGENKPASASQQTEKKLKIGVIILSILLIGFLIAVIVVTALAIKSRKPEVCLTEGCIKSAAEVLQRIDRSVDPCEDFVTFSCGKWMENNREGNGTTIYEKIDQHLKLDLKRYMEEESKDTNKPTSVRKFLKMFDTCLNYDGMDMDTANTLRTIMQEIGGWPLAERNWREVPYHWSVLYSNIYNILDISTKVISVVISTNLYETSENIVHVSQPSLDSNQPLDLNFTSKLANFFTGKDISAMKEDLKDLEWMDTYIRNISKTQDQIFFIEGEVKVVTVHELNNLYPTVNWLPFLENIFSEFTDPVGHRFTLRDKVLLLGTSYLTQVLEKMKEGKITKRMLVNYMMAKFIQGLSDVYPIEIEEGIANHNKDKKKIKDKAVSDANFDRCLDTLGLMCSGIVDYIYGKYRKDKSIDPKMIKYMFSAMDDMVSDAAWLDPKTRKEVKDKLNSMIPLISYPPWTQDRNALDSFYKTLPEVTDNVFENHIRGLTFLNEKIYQRITVKNKRDDPFWWLPELQLRGAVVNAFYFPNYNFIVLPAAIQSYPFFVPDRPNYMNFGGMGLIVAHEITHGLDKVGSTRDKFGNIRNWWMPESKKEFDKGAQCFIEQYNSYGFPGGLYINGEQTLSENIADNGGVRQAFLAYQKWRKDHGEEKLLPGLEEYDINQLLFISLGGSWCATITGSILEALVNFNTHSPNNYRVIGSLSNLKEFSDVFSCKSGSAMNPTKKCSIW